MNTLQTNQSLSELYESACSDPITGARDTYRARKIAGQTRHFVAATDSGDPALLFTHHRNTADAIAPIQLQNLSVQPSVTCQVRDLDTVVNDTFSIVTCHTADAAIRSTFLHICESLIPLLGIHPTAREIAEIVFRLVDLFQDLQQPSTKTAAGLFGELIVIANSRDPLLALDSWHPANEATFDFSCGPVRLEVKATSTRQRVHEFAMEQCSSPPECTAIVASLIFEQSGGGTTIADLLSRISDAVGTNHTLKSKLFAVSAKALGSSFSSAITIPFDERQARNSTRYFRADDIPAIREPIANGVSGVRFRSNLVSAFHLQLRDIEEIAVSSLGLFPTHF